jgi:hypothetical protein
VEAQASGDKSRGSVEIVIDARQLAAQEISNKEVDGRYPVLFQGGASFSSPDLLVAIDPAHSEIVAVRPLVSRKPASPR